MAGRCLLYYITDRSQFRGDERSRSRALLAKVAEAARASVDYIQLRERDLSARELESLAREAVAAISENASASASENISKNDREQSPSTRLLINHRTDIALAVGADGVHLRGDDVGPHEVRRVLSASVPLLPTKGRFLVAASCHSNEDIIRAESDAVDFAVFAPVFEKSSAPGSQPTGVIALRQARSRKIPLLALGGVTIENAESCLDAGAAGVAGIRLFQENKIGDIVRALRAL
ncbi:MAG TPA: thiamine phosphate synthase [Terriglobales bacterium]|jgi:thiamine-phosphate pyrophosphorylase|nr:thiamine phosphate synthase [Terriglobales bacterium]